MVVGLAAQTHVAALGATVAEPLPTRALGMRGEAFLLTCQAMVNARAPGTVAHASLSTTVVRRLAVGPVPEPPYVARSCRVRHAVLARALETKWARLHRPADSARALVPSSLPPSTP